MWLALFCTSYLTLLFSWKWWQASDRVILLESHIRDMANERLELGERCPYCSDRTYR